MEPKGPCNVLLQMHLYLPSADHPAHDTVRAIVKDSTDSFNGDSSRVFVDSGETAELFLFALQPLTPSSQGSTKYCCLLYPSAQAHHC